MTKHRKSKTVVLALAALLGIGLESAFAQLVQLPAQDYIDRMERPGRVVKLRVDAVIEELGLEPGDVVADIGSGGGAFSLPMARAIGPGGTLYAVDIDQEMLDFVSERAEKEGVGNITTVLGEYDDPKLPVKSVDVAFFHRVLHMIEHRQAYINAVAKYLKPDGRIVIIDRNREDSESWMWLNQSDVDSWMAAISFYPAQEFELYDDRYFVVYQRPYGDSVILEDDWH